MHLIPALLITAIAAYALDYVNIDSNMNLYGFLLKNTRILPAVLFYAAYPVLLYLVVIKPPTGIYSRAALFSLAVYGVYHLTNLATIPEFHVKFSVYDTIWGILLTLILTRLILYLTD